MSKLPVISRPGPSVKKPRARSKAQHNLQLHELEARLLMSSNVPAQGTFTAVLGSALSARVLIQTPTSLQQSTTSIATAQSPTGQNPQLLWSAQQQGVWGQMVRDNNPWWKLVQHNAQYTPYGDHGGWATLAYQMTGNTAYAAKAWSLIQPLITRDPKSGNILRENFEQFALSFNWLLPALTPTQRTIYVNGLNRWSSWALNHVRLSDFDETVSEYFGMAMVDIATKGYNPLAGTWLNQTSTGHNAGISIGGLIATAADRSTMRNAIAQYMQLAAGGVSVESSQYNLNTLQLLTMGVEAIQAATGHDYFPEVTQFLHQAALAQMYEMAPTLKASYQWGDNEHPRNIQLAKRVGLLGALAGVTQNDAKVGPYINQFVQDLATKYGYQGFNTAAPSYAWMFYTFNPYAAKADWRSLPDGFFAPGRGMLYFHDGWSNNSSFFGAQFSSRTNEDHQVNLFGDFQLYSQGGWAVTHPIGYGKTADSGLAGNDMLIAGLSSMQDRHVNAQQFGPNGSYAYVSGTTEGSYYASNYYNPPPNFLQEWTRSLFYLPSANGGPDTVIVFDRVNANDPTKLSNFSRYTAADQQTIASAPALDQWLIHSDVKPTMTANGFSWNAANGQQVQVTTLLPAQHTVTSYSEQQVLGPSSNFVGQEIRGYQTRISSTSTSSWQTFLNVVQSGAKGTAFDNTLVKADDDSAEGTLVHRAGQSDTLVLFGALQAGRVLEQGYTVRYTASTANSQVNVTDLDPHKHWTISVNGGAAQQLTVSSQGVASFTVQGTGTESFKITAT